MIIYMFISLKYTHFLIVYHILYEKLNSYIFISKMLTGLQFDILNSFLIYNIIFHIKKFFLHKIYILHN